MVAYKKKEHISKKGNIIKNCCVNLTAKKYIDREKSLIRTLCSNKNDWDIINVSIMRHFCIIRINSIEASFIFQTKHKDNRINPCGELKKE